MDVSKILDDDWGDWDTSDKSLEVIDDNDNNGTLEVIKEEKEIKETEKNKQELTDPNIEIVKKDENVERRDSHFLVTEDGEKIDLRSTEEREEDTEENAEETEDQKETEDQNYCYYDLK